jgi:uncharacterized delta-60 repeat protein
MKYTRISLILIFTLFVSISTFTSAQNTFLDSTFNNSGKVLLPVGNYIDNITAINVQTDGKIIATGNSGDASGYVFAAARFNVDGSLDNTYGNFGIRKTTFGISTDHCGSAKIQTDGKIILAGSSVLGNQQQFAMLRYTTSGNLDSTFGNAGKVLTPIANSISFGNQMVIQNDGKIVIAGYSSINIGISYDFALIRYLNNGTIDSSFGTNGVVLTDMNAYDDVSALLTLQTDGKLVLAGSAGNGLNYDVSLARYNIDGTLDQNFGVAGKQITPVGYDHDSPRAIAVQADGRILVAGGTRNATDYDFLILRYNSNGLLDSTFGTNGIVIQPIGSSDEAIESMLIQNDGKIVIAGYTKTDSLPAHFIVSRFNNDGSQDSTFGDSGIIHTSFGNDYEGAYALAFQNDGKLIAGGSSGDGSVYNFAIARYKNSFALEIAVNKYQNPDYHFIPNPCSAVSKLALPFCPGNATLRVYNISGQIVKSIHDINNCEIEFHRGTLTPGVYYIILSENDKIIMTDKLSIGN